MRGPQKVAEGAKRGENVVSSAEIADDNRKSLVAMIVFTLIWNAISLPLLLAFPSEYFDKGNKAMLLALLFPLLGAGLILSVLYKLIHHWKYGTATLVLQQIPVVIGGSLSGAIKVPKQIESDEGYDL